MLAVLSGLRPGFMLDYAALAPERLAAAAASLAGALQLPAAGLCVVALGDCAYLVRPGMLPGLGPCGASAVAPGAAAPPVMLVAFDGSRAARWADGAEAAQAAAQLGALRAGLVLAAEQSARVGSCCCGGGIPVVEASSIPGWQRVVPPTASGYLLGYPALYLCHSLEGAQAATRCLSSGGLCLHSVSCRLRLPPEMEALEEGQPLLAFSVPAELATAAEWHACRDAWQARLQQQHHLALQQGLPWSEPHLAVASQQPRPVAL